MKRGPWKPTYCKVCKSRDVNGSCVVGVCATCRALTEGRGTMAAAYVAEEKAKEKAMTTINDEILRIHEIIRALGPFSTSVLIDRDMREEKGPDGMTTAPRPFRASSGFVAGKPEQFSAAGPTVEAALTALRRHMEASLPAYLAGLDSNTAKLTGQMADRKAAIEKVALASEVIAATADTEPPVAGPPS